MAGSSKAEDKTIKQLNSKIKSLTCKNQNLQTSLDESEKNLGQFKTKFTTARTEYQKLKQEHQTLKQSSENNEIKLTKQFNSKINTLTNETKNLREKLDQSDKTLEQLQIFRTKFSTAQSENKKLK